MRRTHKRRSYTLQSLRLLSLGCCTLLFPRDPLCNSIHPHRLFISTAHPLPNNTNNQQKKKKRKKCIDVIIGRRPRVDCVGARRQMSLLKVTHIIYRQGGERERERGQGGRKERRQPRERAGWPVSRRCMYISPRSLVSFFLFSSIFLDLIPGNLLYKMQ